MVCDFRALISPHIQICRSTVGIMSLRFNSDGTFRVLQMADIQDGPDVREDTIRLIEAAIRKAHPDLIVLTGDQIRGYDPAYIDTFLRRRGEQPGTHVRAVTEIEAKIRGIKRHPIAKTLTKSQPSDERWMIDGIGTDSPKLVKSAGRNGSASKLESWAEAINRVTAASLLDETRQKVRDTFAAFLGPALESHIPFAATYGNHDFQCGILADEQDDLYREFAGCMNPVAGSSPLALEPGTFALPIEASDGSGRITMSVMMVNSGDYADTADAGDGNGRQSVTEYAKYAPNVAADLSRLPERIAWNDALLRHLQALDAKKPVILCGDLNAAYNDADLAGKSQGMHVPGFTREERSGMAALLQSGFVDAYRHVHPDTAPGAFAYRKGIRAGGLDYFLVSARMVERIVDANAHPRIRGSDHYPMELVIR